MELIVRQEQAKKSSSLLERRDYPVKQVLVSYFLLLSVVMQRNKSVEDCAVPRHIYNRSDICVVLEADQAGTQTVLSYTN